MSGARLNRIPHCNVTGRKTGIVKTMPTLFRLLSVIAVAVGIVYGAMLAIVTFVAPQPREIVQAVALPQASELRTGRSAAQALDSQAAALVHHDRRKDRSAR